MVYLFSQSFDVDKKIRDLTDHLYIVQNFCNFLSIARRVTKHLTVVHADRSAQEEAKIVDDYSIDSLLLAPFGSVRLTYIPKYVKYFKSFDPPRLPDFEGEPLPEYQKERYSWLHQLKERRDVLRSGRIRALIGGHVGGAAGRYCQIIILYMEFIRLSEDIISRIVYI